MACQPTIGWNLDYRAKGALDLRDIFLFWNVKTVEELADFIEADSFYYKDLSEKIWSIQKFLKVAVPDKLISSQVQKKENIIARSFEWLQKKPYCDDLVSFFRDHAQTWAKNYFNFDVHTKEGTKPLKLDYGANFRFKPVDKTLNLFNCPSEYRHILIPQKKNHFIYAADFKQFEFRTYLDIHPQPFNRFDNLNLYDFFSKWLNLNYDDAKKQILAYIYGSRNDFLDSVLDRKAILNQVQYEEFYRLREKCVVLNRNKSSHTHIHTIVQTISQFRLLEKISKIIALLSDYDSMLIYPLHDELVFSINKKEIKVVSNIRNILQDDVYKITEYIGKDLYNMVEL